MKKIKIILTMFIAVLSFLLVSCDRDITEPVMSANPSSPTVSDVSLTAAFTVANADSTFRFSWAKADFGFNSSTTYGIQLSPTADFSANVATLLSTQALSGAVKVSDVNTLLLSWNYNIGTPVTVYYRISASILSSVSTVYSTAKSKSLTPYDAVINYPMIYAPGAYQGWSPGATNGRLYSYGFNTTYSGILRIVDGTNTSSDFKLTPEANWNSDWGGSLTKSGSNYSGTLTVKGSNMTVTAGCYVVTFNTSTLAITLTKTDDWGIIGSATANGWNGDQNMFYNGQRKMWEYTGDLVVGEIKFRANDGWDNNYGDTGADGTLDAGGSNIAITVAGNYTIRFDPVTLKYTVKKN